MTGSRPILLPASCDAGKNIYIFLRKKKVLVGGKFLAKDFGIFLPKGGYTFCPKFCPYYAISKFFNSSAYMYLVVFYVGEYGWVAEVTNINFFLI
jgi:hypothetical protein